MSNASIWVPQRSILVLFADWAEQDRAAHHQDRRNHASRVVRVVFCILCLLSIVSCTPPPDPTPTLDINPTRGRAGETTFTIVGEGFTPGLSITLSVVDAARNEVNDEAIQRSVQVSADGRFTTTVLPPSGAPPGRYTVLAPTGRSPSEQVAASLALDHEGEELKVTPEHGSPGTTFTVDGQNFEANQILDYEVFDKAGVPADSGEVVTDTAGRVSFSLPSHHLTPGGYMVYIGPARSRLIFTSAGVLVDPASYSVKVGTAPETNGGGSFRVVPGVLFPSPNGHWLEGNVFSGTAIDVWAAPREDSRLAGWIVNGVPQDSKNPLTLSITANTEILASFTRVFRAASLATLPTWSSWGGVGSDTLLAIGSDQEVYVWRHYPGIFGVWESLGGDFSAVTATVNPGGGVAALALDTDGRVRLATQVGQAPSSWKGWLDLTEPPAVEARLPTRAAQIASTTNPTGGLAAFVVGKDGHIWHAWQDQPSGPWRGWVDMTTPPEPPESVPTPIASISATTNPLGGLALFALASDGKIWHARQDAPKGAWLGWLDLTSTRAGPVSANMRLPFRSFVSTRNPEGGLAVFGVVSDGTIWHAWQPFPKSGWLGWIDLTIPPRRLRAVKAPVSQIAAGYIFDGGLALFAIDREGEVAHAWQEHPREDWTGWETLSGDATALAARSSDYEIDGMRVFIIDSSGRVATRSQPFPRHPWSPRWFELLDVR